MKFFPFKKKAVNRRVTRPVSPYRMKRSLLDWAYLAFRIVVSLAVAVGLYGFFAHSTYFDLREVQVGGNFSRISREALLQLAEIPYGRNVFGLNLYKMAQNLKRDPWIEQIAVRRVLPHGLYIEVREHEPRAVLTLKTQKESELFLVNERGVIFKKAQPGEEKGLAVLNGLTREQLEKFPGYYGPRVVEALGFIVAFTQTVSECQITELNTRTAGLDAVITGADGKVMKVFFGKGDTESKIKRFADMVHYMNATGTRYKKLDMHVEGKVFAQME